MWARTICLIVIIILLVIRVDAQDQPIIIKCGPGVGNCNGNYRAQKEYYWQLREPGIYVLNGTDITLEYSDTSDSWVIKRNNVQHGFSGTLDQEAALAWDWFLSLSKAGYNP